MVVRRSTRLTEDESPKEEGEVGALERPSLVMECHFSSSAPCRTGLEDVDEEDDFYEQFYLAEDGVMKVRKMLANTGWA